MSDREVLRLHIRSSIKDDATHDRATAWCLENGYAGVGWGVWDREGLSGMSWAQYAEYGAPDGNVRRFHDAPPGTLLHRHG